MPFALDGTTMLRNVKVAMRDGVRLATSVYLPPGEGPFPTVLVRTAYNRVPMHGAEFTRRGLAFVVQDCRGRYDSEGLHYPFTAEERERGRHARLAGGAALVQRPRGDVR